jgi:hypothetical protein
MADVKVTTTTVEVARMEKSAVRTTQALVNVLRSSKNVIYVDHVVVNVLREYVPPSAGNSPVVFVVSS